MILRAIDEPKRHSDLELLPAGQSVSKNLLVRVLKHAAGSNPSSQTRHLNRKFGQLIGDIECRTITFYGGIGSHDDLDKVAAPHTLDQFIYRQLIWPNALERCYPPQEHMIDAAKYASLLQGH